MDTSKPQPERFLVYKLLPDGKGFTIAGCKFVFKLDRHGGWRDQYGHYYNANGEPDFEPEDAELTPSEGSLHSDEYVDDYDQFEPNYDEVDDYEEEQYSQHDIRNMQRISRNMQSLSAYPADKLLRVYFSNMPFKAPPKSVYEAYSKQVPGIVNIIFDIENQRRNGEGHFIMQDCKKAEKLVKLEGEKVIQREVHFDVEKLSELIMDPIKEADTIPFWNTKAGPYTAKNTTVVKQQKKDDIPRFKAAPAQEKKQVKKEQNKQVKRQQKKSYVSKVESKPSQKTEQKKPQQKNDTKQSKQDQKPDAKQSKPQQKQQQKPKQKVQQKSQQQYRRYQLNFQVFESRTRFFNWLADNKGNKDTDIKDIIKQQTNGKIQITLDAKVSFVNSVKGKQYMGKKVVFTPVNSTH